MSPEGLACARSVFFAGILAVCAGLNCASDVPTVPDDDWLELEEGLELAGMVASVRAAVGDSRIRVLRVDPARFDLVLLNASAQSPPQSLTAREWCERHDCVAAINASMYATDHRSSVSLMRTRDHVNNAHVTKDNAILAFDALADSLPPVRIIDRVCENFDSLASLYGSLVQSIRMLDCKGRNTWRPQPEKRWSAALIGMDGAGRLLFIFVRSPYSMHELIDMLLDLPLGLIRLQYAEGGPEAQLYVESGERVFSFAGSFETGFFESDDNVQAWPVPNVVALRRKP